MTTFPITIMGERWKVKFVRSITHTVEGKRVRCDGLCVPDKREIKIDASLKGEILADTLIHEVMHAAGWNLNEEFVDQTSTDIARALYHPEIRGRS